MDHMEGSILILGKWKHSVHNYNDLENLLHQLKKIGFQIFGRIFHDIDKKNHCPAVLKLIKRDSIQYYRTAWITPEVTGWYFQFKLLKDAQSELKFNPDHWLIP